jgi:hypothetical protein
VILARQRDEHRTHLRGLELQTRYLVMGMWASSGHAKKGQAAAAAAEIHFLPKADRKRELPTMAQVASLMPVSSRTRIRG